MILPRASGDRTRLIPHAHRGARGSLPPRAPRSFSRRGAVARLPIHGHVGGVMGFLHTDKAEPHAARTRAILEAHPEIRRLIGKNPWSMVLIVGLVSALFALAALLSSAPWWVVLLVAYTVGALIDHTLWVLIHEAAHNLVFRRSIPNYLAGIAANLPMVVPSAVSFKRYHLKHHSFQGVYALDADLPAEWEARWVGRSPLRKAIWLLLFPLVQITRPFRIAEVPLV